MLFLVSIAGVGLQFSNEKLDKDQIYYSVISSVLFTISQLLLEKTKPYIHHSIDTIYVSLALTLVMPSFVLGDYSMNPAKFTIEGPQMVYYMVSGFLTFLFHSQLTQLACISNNKKQHLSLYVLYVAGLVGMVIDSSVFEVQITGLQVLGVCLMLLPSVLVDGMFLRK